VIVYPNPASSVVTVSTPSSYDQSKVTLFDAAGKLVQTGTINNSICELKIGSLPSGIYFLKVDGAAGLTVRKILKN
jgi:serine protease